MRGVGLQTANLQAEETRRTVRCSSERLYTELEHLLNTVESYLLLRTLFLTLETPTTTT